MQKITLICTLILAVVFGCACGRAQSAKPTAAPTATQAPIVTPAASLAPVEKPVAAEGEELLTLVKTEEEAKAIAEQYGIELVSFSYGVATFHTEEDPRDVIARGEKNGWPTLSLNGEATIY